MKSISKRASAVLGTAVVATLSAGIAGAVWTSPTGSGNSSATGYTAVATNITASSTNNSAQPLYPGANVTNTVTITNPNPYPVVVTDITQGSGNAAAGACTAGTVNFATRSDSTGLAQTGTTTKAIAAGGTGTYDVVVSMASTADNACQGLSFTLPATVASKSANF